MISAPQDALRQLVVTARWRRAVRLSVTPATATEGAVVTMTSGRSRPLEPVHVSVLSRAHRPFTAAELHGELAATGAALPFEELIDVVHYLASAGAIVPAESEDLSFITDPGRRLIGLLARPAVYIPLFAVLCILATFELGDIKGRAHAVIETPAPPAVGMPVEVAPWTFLGIALLGTLVTAYARQIFRLAIAGGNASATRVTFAMKGLIPVLHANAVASTSGATARFVRATSGFFFDLAMIQLWMLASGSGDFVWRSVASIELAVVITLLAIALNPLAEYDAYRALSELLGIGNLRVASSEALARIFRGRRRTGDVVLGWYKILGFAYMVLVLIVLTNLVASFLRRASYMPEQRSRYVAAAIVVVAWVGYLGRRAWADYRARRVADISLPTGAAPLIQVGTLGVARSRVLRDDLTLVRSDGRAPFSASELARSVDVFSYSHRELPPLTEAEAEEDDLLSMAIFRRPLGMLAPQGHELLQVAKALIRSTRPRETHEIVTDVQLMEGYHDRGFSDLVARIEGLSFRELVSRMSVNAAPEVGSILESFAMVARDRATGLIDAVVITEGKAARRLERLTELMGAIDSTAEVDIEYVHAALAATVRPAERDYLEKVRGLPVDFQEKYGILPLVLERNIADFDATFVHHARALGLLEPDPHSPDGGWRLALDGPALLFPSGSRSKPSGLKARWMHRSLRFHEEMRRTSGWKRYRDFLPRGARSTALAAGVDLAAIPGWYDVPEDATELYVHEGELKAMAHHHLVGTPSLALGGVEYQFLAAFSAAVATLAPLRRVFICFDSDIAAPTMRLRLDGMPDAIFRGLQLAWLLHDRCKLEVFWVPGLRSETEKIDLDDLLALSDAERTELTATYRRRIAEPLRFADLLRDVPELGPYLAESIQLAEKMYASMRAAFEAGVADPAGASTVLAREAPVVFEQARIVDRGARALFDKKQLVERLVGAPADL